MEAFAAKMLVPDDQITTWVDVSGAPLEAKWNGDPRARHPDQRHERVHAMGFDGWRDGWANEAYILQESRVETTLPETDLFAGIV